MADGGKPSKLNLIVFSGEFDKVHYALAMASAALAVNIPVTLFFTMRGIDALLKAPEDEPPAWNDLAATDGRTGIEAETDNIERGVASFTELLEACSALGAEFMVCEMGLRAIGRSRDEVRDDIKIVDGGLVTFYQGAGSDGEIVFI